MPKQATKKTSSNRGKIWAIVIAAVIAVAGFAVAYPPQDSIHKAIDIAGGTSVVMKASTTDGSPVTQEQMETSKAIVESRVNSLGASEAEVSIISGANGTNDQLLVQIPGMSDPTTALATIGKTGVLEFARLDSITDETVRSNIESGNIIDYSSVSTTQTGDVPTGGGGLADYSDAKHITLASGTYTPLFTGEHITQVNVGRESDASANYAVNLRLDSQAAAIFAEATTELAPTKGQIVTILDGEVINAPSVQTAITGGEVSITGNYTLDEAKAFQTVLDSGSLPVSFTYEQSQTVGPTLGQGEFEAAVLVLLLGLIVALVYLFAFYRGMGIIPALSMIIFGCMYLGVLAAMSYANLFSMSLAGLAGIVLTLGLSFDSYVLCAERLKEELKEGRSLKSASNTALKHAMITSIDANVVSIISALALFFLASSTVRGFGLTLSIGIVCNLIVLVLFIVPVMRLLAPRVMRNHPAFWDVKYALELGDVRAGTENYMTPVEVSIAKDEEREQGTLARERKKEHAAVEHERKKAADQRAKELRKKQKESDKERAKELKRKEKETLERIKAEDAQRDAERKAAKKAVKEAVKEDEKAEKQESKQDVKDDVVEEDVVIVDENESAASDEAQAIKGDTEQQPEGVAGVTTDEDVEEVIEEREDEPKSAEEIAQLIAQSADFVEPATELPRVTDETMRTSGPETVEEQATRNANGANRTAANAGAPGQPRMNRAQRRAQERANKKKKKN